MITCYDAEVYLFHGIQVSIYIHYIYISVSLVIINVQIAE